MCIISYKMCISQYKAHIKVSSAKIGLNCLLQVITFKLLQIIKKYILVS